jgi:L-asparagine oxygenase
MEQHIIHLTNEEIDVLHFLASQIKHLPLEMPEDFCLETKQCSHNLPSRIREQLKTFAQSGSQNGFLLIKHFPFNDKEELENIQAIFIQCMGEMVAYEAEGGGNLFQNIIPSPSMAREQTSVGSNTELEIHTEQAFSKLRPDILSLSCIRGDPNALTYILPVGKIIENTNSSEKRLLREQLWKTGVDLSFKLHGKEFLESDIRGPMSILSGPENDPQLVFDQDLMFGFNESGERLLKKIVDIYYKERIEHNLTPGEIIFIDNRRAVHGRSPFFPRYDGNDRHLIRCFATLDYEKSEYARIGRMVLAIYS